MKLQKYVVKNAFKSFLPEIADFEIVEETIPKLATNEFLVRAKFISVDPYMRAFAHSYQVPYEQFAFQVGEVVESNNKVYPQGVFVVSHSTWSDYVILDSRPDKMFSLVPYQPDLGDLPLSYSIGALGMPGITAYLGFLELCQPLSGEVVCVTSAAGAVGSLVGQIAKIKGCIVIGFTGSDKKVQILLKELGFDHAFNYKTANIRQCLKSCVPSGIDCYFDNVGGEVSSIVMDCMKQNGRVAICGSISSYGESSSKNVKKVKNSMQIKEIAFPGWSSAQREGALRQMKEWIEKGDIKVKETISSGFESLPRALISMLKGNNVGKALVSL